VVRRGNKEEEMTKNKIVMMQMLQSESVSLRQAFCKESAHNFSQLFDNDKTCD
jgi:hypothetical protein